VFDKEGNNLSLRAKLDMIDEHRKIAELKRKAFQHMVAITVNSHVKHKRIKKSDLVLRKAKLKL